MDMQGFRVGNRVYALEESARVRAESTAGFRRSKGLEPLEVERWAPSFSEAVDMLMQAGREYGRALVLEAVYAEEEELPGGGSEGLESSARVQLAAREERAARELVLALGATVGAVQA